MAYQALAYSGFHSLKWLRIFLLSPPGWVPPALSSAIPIHTPWRGETLWEHNTMSRPVRVRSRDEHINYEVSAPSETSVPRNKTGKWLRDFNSQSYMCTFKNRWSFVSIKRRNAVVFSFWDCFEVYVSRLPCRGLSLFVISSLGLYNYISERLKKKKKRQIHSLWRGSFTIFDSSFSSSALSNIEWPG